jgi:hypothetical protein
MVLAFWWSAEPLLYGPVAIASAQCSGAVAETAASTNDTVPGRSHPGHRASTMVCTPCSLSQEVGLGLGARASEQRLRKVANDGGFTRFRRAAETPLNLVFEARC